MSERLLPCPSCARHVRASEEACPFCAGELPSSRASAALPRAPVTRLSRAALYAFGASAAVVAACGGSTGSTVADGGTDGGDESLTVPVYGGPGVDGGPALDAASNPDDAASDPDDAASDPDGIAPPYGAPP